MRSKIIAICDKLSNEKNNKDKSIYSLKHRQEYLVEQNKMEELKTSKVDSFVKITEEYCYETNLENQNIPSNVINNNSNRFTKKNIRVPYIAISKYNNAEILKHQFIKSEDGYVSLDSQEELVDKDDQVWYYKNSTLSVEGKQYSVPRLSVQEFSINPRNVRLDANKRRIEVHETCLFVPAWYTTNIAHWIIDVLPRLYFANQYLEQSMIIILPKAPTKTGIESLEATV